MDTIESASEPLAYSPLPATSEARAQRAARRADSVDSAWAAGAVAVAAAACGGFFWRPAPAAPALEAARPAYAPVAVVDRAPEAERRPLPPEVPAAVGRRVSPAAAPALEAAPAETPLAAAETPVAGPIEPADALLPLPDSGFVWARSRPRQGWAWPSRLELFRQGPLPERERQRLVGWFPDNAPGEQLLYAVRSEDGSSTRDVYEKDLERALRPARAGLAGLLGIAGAPRTIEEVRAVEREQLRVQQGAENVRDVTAAGDNRHMAELTYADGHKEVVPYDPLVFDLGGGGVKTAERKVLFDLIGTHRVDKTQWMNDLDGNAGMLVFDATHSGRSGKSGAEVFGDRTDLDGQGRPDGYVNGYEALRALADKAVREGVLDAAVIRRGVLDAPALAALGNAYGLRMKVGGFNKPAISLAKAGVKAIALSAAPVKRVSDFDSRGNDLLLQPGAVFLRADGTTGTYANVFLTAQTGNLGLKTSGAAR